MRTNFDCPARVFQTIQHTFYGLLTNTQVVHLICRVMLYGVSWVNRFTTVNYTHWHGSQEAQCQKLFALKKFLETRSFSIIELLESNCITNGARSPAARNAEIDSLGFHRLINRGFYYPRWSTCVSNFEISKVSIFEFVYQSVYSGCLFFYY